MAAGVAAAKGDTVVVLAAGRGERVGVSKGLVLVDGVPWLERQLERLAECGLSRAVVVLGHAFDAHVSALPWVELALARGVPFLGLEVSVARNEAPERGPFSSLACGLARVGEGWPAFVLPVDAPCPGRAVWESLALALTLAPPVLRAAVPAREGRGGHPVFLSAAFVARLLEVPLDAPDARLDAQLRALAKEEVARVPCDDVRAFTNLNRREDWDALV